MRASYDVSVSEYTDITHQKKQTFFTVNKIER